MSKWSSTKLIDTTGNSQGILIDQGLLITGGYLQSIAEGYIPNHYVWRKIGYTNASSATETTLWNPGTQYVFPTGNISVSVASTSASDTSAGTGARTIHMDYLDSNYEEKTHTFTLNGVTNVNGPTDFYRVNTFHVETAGSTGKSVGIISLYLTGTPATLYSQIPANATRARNSVYTVPAGKTVYIHDVMFTAGYKTAGKTVRITLHTSISPDNVVSTSGTIFWPRWESIIVDGMCNKVDGAPIKCPEKTDLKVSVVGETLAQCTSSLDGWIETN